MPYSGALAGELGLVHLDQSLIIGSTSANTLTSLTINAQGGGDGYTLFFGVTQNAAAVPEPASLALLGTTS